MELKSALDWLYSTQLFGIKLGLENTVELLKRAGAMPGPDMRVVHVAGTNGKGSTCAMIEIMARAQGLKTGLFTSPHLVDFSERIRVDGRQIADEGLLALLEEVKTLSGSMVHPPTFFELALVMAMKHFIREGVELAILETGLGGRLDATNAVPKNVAVLTPVGLDHQQYLGDSLEEIAFEKAGIIASGKPVVSAIQEPVVEEVIAGIAEKNRSRLVFAASGDSTPQPSLPGLHQRANAALAIAALRELGELPGEDVIRQVLSQVLWPGRFEFVPGYGLILDGAHNPHAMKELVSAWKLKYGTAMTPVVFAASADKNIDEMIRLLDEIASQWFLAPCSSPRILPPGEMKAHVANVSKSPVTVFDSLDQLIPVCPDSGLPFIVAGSLFLIGDVKAWLAGSSRRQTLQ